MSVSQSIVSIFLSIIPNFIPSDDASDSSRMELNPNMLFQRAFPERTPLTMEELEWLVNHDQLRLPDDGDRIENETS